MMDRQIKLVDIALSYDSHERSFDSEFDYSNCIGSFRPSSFKSLVKIEPLSLCVQYVLICVVNGLAPFFK
jgi:hypothetical protein